MAGWFRGSFADKTFEPCPEDSFGPFAIKLPKPSSEKEIVAFRNSLRGYLTAIRELRVPKDGAEWRGIAQEASRHWERAELNQREWQVTRPRFGRHERPGEAG